MTHHSSTGNTRQALGRPTRPRERNMRGLMTTSSELIIAILEEALRIVSDVDTSEGAEEDGFAFETK
jgi:hypothetical protein